MTENKENTTQPIKLKIAERMTAFLAEIALVEIAVATELGESVQPLTKTTPKDKMIEMRTKGLPKRVKNSPIDKEDTDVSVFMINFLTDINLKKSPISFN